MSYGRTKDKKIILQADIAGNVNQDELWAILDGVDSDVEENIDNLLVDSDTEFETITEDATAVLNSNDKKSKIPLLSKNSLEAVVHSDIKSKTLSNEKESPDHVEKITGDREVNEVDFTLSKTRPTVIKTR